MSYVQTCAVLLPTPARVRSLSYAGTTARQKDAAASSSTAAVRAMATDSPVSSSALISADLAASSICPVRTP